jgi:DNA integrity scanning protein DisA with diadenylate cyclase activity
LYRNARTSTWEVFEREESFEEREESFEEPSTRKPRTTTLSLIQKAARGESRRMGSLFCLEVLSPLNRSKVDGFVPHTQNVDLRTISQRGKP